MHRQSGMGRWLLAASVSLLLTQLVGCMAGSEGFANPSSVDAVNVLSAVQERDAGQLSKAFGRRLTPGEVDALHVRLLGSNREASFGSMSFAQDALATQPDGTRAARVTTGGSDQQAGLVVPPSVVSEVVSVTFTKRGSSWYAVSLTTSPSAGQ